MGIDMPVSLRQHIRHGERKKGRDGNWGNAAHSLDASTGAAEVTTISTAEHVAMLKEDVKEAVRRFQVFENIAAAVIPYPGGIIAFGSREAILGMMGDAEVDDGGG
jgi:hypothetical protein